MARQSSILVRFIAWLARSTTALLLAVGLTLAMFLVLPFLQQMAKAPESDMELRQVNTANLPPPPPPPVEEEPEPEEDEPPPPPDLSEEAPPLDLSQLEMALNPGFGGGVGDDFEVRLLAAAGERANEDVDAVFAMDDLDQKPRVVYQPPPEYPAELRRRKLAGTVHVLFVVDERGRVKNPIVKKSTHPAFEQPALQAIRRWRFEPGRSGGKPVAFRMRVPITFTQA